MRLGNWGTAPYHIIQYFGIYSHRGCVRRIEVKKIKVAKGEQWGDSGERVKCGGVDTQLQP